jgi:hypothetical protein
MKPYGCPQKALRRRRCGRPTVEVTGVRLLSSGRQSGDPPATVCENDASGRRRFRRAGRGLEQVGGLPGPARFAPRPPVTPSIGQAVKTGVMQTVVDRSAARTGLKEDDAGVGRALTVRTKDALKRSGYRWSDGSDGRPRSWYIDVDEVSLDAEIASLRAKIYPRDLDPRFQTLTAFDRFSVRS